MKTLRRLFFRFYDRLRPPREPVYWSGATYRIDHLEFHAGGTTVEHSETWTAP